MFAELKSTHVETKMQSEERTRGEAVFQAEKDRIRSNFNVFTERAYRMLPPFQQPRILDIGCGTGVPTLLLAGLSCGEVVGLDIDAKALHLLEEKAEKMGLSGRVKTVNRSLMEMDFAAGSFDIIWAEGSIAVVGFERGLMEWLPLLKSGGCLVVHDEYADIDEKRGLIFAHGCDLLGSFEVAPAFWENKYHIPLRRVIARMRAEFPDDADMLAVLDREEKELEFFREHPERCRSVFFVMRKRQGAGTEDQL